MPRPVDVWRERAQLVSIIAAVLVIAAFVVGGTLFLVLAGMSLLAGIVALACLKRWRDALVSEHEPVNQP